MVPLFPGWSSPRLLLRMGLSALLLVPLILTSCGSWPFLETIVLSVHDPPWSMLEKMRCPSCVVFLPTSRLLLPRPMLSCTFLTTRPCWCRTSTTPAPSYIQTLPSLIGPCFCCPVRTCWTTKGTSPHASTRPHARLSLNCMGTLTSMGALGLTTHFCTSKCLKSLLPFNCLSLRPSLHLIIF